MKQYKLSHCCFAVLLLWCLGIHSLLAINFNLTLNSSTLLPFCIPLVHTHTCIHLLCDTFQSTLLQFILTLSPFRFMLSIHAMCLYKYIRRSSDVWPFWAFACLIRKYLSYKSVEISFTAYKYVRANSERDRIHWLWAGSPVHWFFVFLLSSLLFSSVFIIFE